MDVKKNKVSPSCWSSMEKRWQLVIWKLRWVD